MLRAFFRAYFWLAPRKASTADFTLEQWGLRFLGKAATRYMLAPYITGIYGTRTGDIKVGAAFPGLVVPSGHSFVSFLFRASQSAAFVGGTCLFFNKEATQASEYWDAGPRHGMGSLTERLDEVLTQRLGARFHRNNRLAGLYELPDDDRNIVLAVPSSEAANLLETVDSTLARALSEVEYTPLVSITAFVGGQIFRRRPHGVGVLIPESERHRALGLLFNSSAFEGRVRDPERWASFSLIFGGAQHPDMADVGVWDDYRLECAVRMELDRRSSV